MSTTHTIPAPLEAADRLNIGRVLRLVFGGLALLAGLAFVGCGGAITWALQSNQDSSGYFTTHTHHYQTATYALSTQPLNVTGATGAIETRLARVRVSVTSANPAKPVFVGIARTEDVNRYLAGVRHDELHDITFQPFGIEYRRLGSGAPASLPASQPFWRMQARGTGTQTVNWPVQAGHWSMVVMNADGSQGISVDGQLAAKVSYLWWVVTALLVMGALSLVVGGLLISSGVRSRGQAA
jgi:hypothetical protein